MDNHTPKHIAIIMDGNGRWAKMRGLSRASGHRAGVESTQKVIKACAEKGIEVLTLFAFSSENWRRPQKEVNHLLDLFLRTLKSEINKLHENGIQFLVIGDICAFSPKLREMIQQAQQKTQHNTGLKLVIAVNYGGRWDLTQAMQRIAQRIENNELSAQDVTEALIQSEVSLGHLPEPDLFIRSSGEQRISNYLLWQLAYTELYFPNTLWPDFDESSLEDALRFYAQRQRRFGYTGEQIKELAHA